MLTPPPSAVPDEVRLRVICTTDLHGHVLPFDYQSDRDAPGRGLAPLATLIRTARAEADNALLVDCGDMLQGTALADRAATAGGAVTRHPLIAAMNRLSYDAAALGNHDFNYGLAPLQAAVGAARFPVLCANLVAELGAHPADDTPIVPQWCSLERTLIDTAGGAHRLRIGLIGTAPPQTAIWDAAVLRGAVAARDAVASVRAHLPDMQAAGCDLVIALCHSGPGAAAPDAMAEDTGRAIAALDGIDAVVLGHSHACLPGSDFAGLDGVEAQAGRIAGKPAVMAGAFGSHLGVMDLRLARPAPDASWRVVADGVALRPGAGAVQDPEIAALTAGAHADTRAGLARPVGRAHVRLHSLFAMVGRSPALGLLADAQTAAAAELVRGTPLGALPLLSVSAPFKHGGPAGPEGFVDIPPGPLTHRHMVELSPFPNQLCVLALTGADLRAWLERAVSAYRTVPRGARDAPLIDPAAPAYTFDEIRGLRYRIDLSRPPLYEARSGARRAPTGTPGRITAITHRGRPVAPDDRFAVATNSYRASGGGGFDMIPQDTPRLHSSAPVRALLTAHVAASGPIAENGPAPWHFAPLGATALVHSAPSATLVAHADPDRRLEALGIGPGGYCMFRLAL